MAIINHRQRQEQQQLQMRHWSLSYYWNSYREGNSILFQELFSHHHHHHHNHDNSPSKSNPISLENNNNHNSQWFGADEQPTSILYAIHVLSRLLASINLWAPSFLFDIRHGMQVSTGFLVFNYLTCLGGFISGVFLANLVVEPTMTQILPGLIRSVYQLIAVVVLFVQFAYIFFGMFSLAYLLSNRQFIQDFFLTHANHLTLTKSYQRRTMHRIFVSTLLFAITSEPLFAAMSLWQDIEQPAFWPQLSAGHFLLAKASFTWLVCFTSLLVSLLCAQVPILTRFLLMATAKHLGDFFHKQLTRLGRRTGSPHTSTDHKHNQQLVALLDPITKDIIRDYSCETLTMDWPLPASPLSQASTQQTPPAVVVVVGGGGGGGGSAAAVHKQDFLSPLVGQLSAQQEAEMRFTSAGGRLMFLYKNFAKTLSELKEMIDLYEQRFGSFHVALICLQGLIVAQWVVAGLTQARLIANKVTKEGHLNDQVFITFNGFYLTPFALRTGIGIVMFVVSNLHTFLSCDCLESQVSKIESQLFKINIDLALSNLNNDHDHQLQTPGELQANFGGGTGGDYLSRYELDQIWSLYDQVVRMGRRANFKLTSGTYYNKKCLLMIFGREVSIVLLYIQVIDIYTHI